MHDWHTTTIGAVATIFDGPHATPRTVDYGPVFLGISALQKGRLDLTDTRHVTPEDFVTWTRRVRPQVNDVVFSYETRIGEAAIIPEDLDCCLGRRMGLVRVDSSVLDPWFFLYFYLAPPFQEFLRSRTIPGATVDRIALKEFPSFPITLPPLTDQRRIVSTLRTIDDKIELNRRTNETLESMARAIFKDLFVDFGPTRAKMEGRASYLASDIWALFPERLDDSTSDAPFGWQRHSIHSQAEWVNGAAYKNMHFSEEVDALPVVKIAELKGGVTSQTKRTSTQLGERYRIADRELLFSWSGNPDTSIDAFVWTGGEAWLNQHIFAVRECGNASLTFLYYLLKTFMPEFAEIARNKQTTGLGHVTKADMKRMLVATGDARVREAFEQLAKPLHDRMIANLFENRTLADTRDLLLPKLMSGEVRILDAEAEVAAAA